MSSDDGPQYENIKPPDDTPPSEYTYVERRAELYRLIEEAGHPRNLRRSQAELGDRYDVSQRQISKDIQRLREYQRDKAGSRAVSTSRWLGEKVVTEIISDAQELKDKADERDDPELHRKSAQLWSWAQEKQMEYNDFLFKLGELEEAPDEFHVSGDPGEAYMAMLKQASEDKEDEP